MQMQDSQRIPASKEKVWAALNDPEVLKKCIPGCQSLEMNSPTEMTATVVFKVGPVKATFGGKVTLSDLDPPSSYRISGEGNGGIARFAKGGALVTLRAGGPGSQHSVVSGRCADRRQTGAAWRSADRFHRKEPGQSVFFVVRRSGWQ